MQTDAAVGGIGAVSIGVDMAALILLGLLVVAFGLLKVGKMIWAAFSG